MQRADSEDGGAGAVLTDVREEPRKLRPVVVAAVVGSFVEYYDFAVYGALAAILSVVFFPPGNPTAALLSTFAIFAVAFFVRPLGGLLWGHLGDKIGRQRTLATVIILMAVGTVGIGLLPSYAAIGVAAPILVVALRCVQGFSAGGEIMGASTFVAEYAPEGRRGFLTSFIQSATTAALLAGAAIAFLLTSIFPEDAVNSWGWRIPFLLAGPIGLIGLYIRLKLEDTPHFKAIQEGHEVTQNPVRETLSHRENYKQIVLAAGVGVVQFVAFYMLLTYMPTYLTEELGFQSWESFLSLTIATAFLMVTIPFAGIVSDRIGRRTTLMVATATLLVLTYPCFLLISQGTFLAAVVGQVLLAIPASATAANLLAAQTEMFPTRIRYTAYAIAMNVGVALFGGTAPFVATYLISATGSNLAPAFYLMFAAALSLITALVMTETAKEPLRDV